MVKFRINYYSFVFSILTIIAGSCGEAGVSDQDKPRAGIWRGVIRMQDQELPFNFRVYHREQGIEIELMNRSERLLLDGITLSGDSINIPLHIFDTTIKAVYSSENMYGIWTKNYLEDYTLSFMAAYGDNYRFSADPEPPASDLSGRWEVYFIEGSDSSLAVGVFNQHGNRLEGTFLRPSGDYRYLEGEVDGDSLKLSTFEGEHAYLFKAVKTGENRLSGMYWSGKTWSQPWSAMKNPVISLPDPDRLTYLKPGYDRISFELPGLDGKPVSLDDPEFKNKVIILEIFGTWCSNCMDETRFLSAWYDRNRNRDVEIIAIAFERKDDLAYARDRIQKLKDRFGIDYRFVFGGKSDKEVASEMFPMLNAIVSFPTMIFIDRQGRVRKIHTGFAGPGTGEHYEQFAEEFDEYMDKLLND